MSFLSKCCCACSSKRTCCESANLNERNGVVQEHSFTALQHESQTVERSAQKLNSSFSAPNEIVVCSSTSFVRLTFLFVFVVLANILKLQRRGNQRCSIACFSSPVLQHKTRGLFANPPGLAQAFQFGNRT